MAKIILAILIGCVLFNTIPTKAQSITKPQTQTTSNKAKAKKKQTTKKKQAIADTTLWIHVKLIEKVEGLSPCGYNKVTGTYKFEVVKLVKGYYPDKEIKIKFNCPKELGENFFVFEKLYYFKISKKMSSYLDTDVAYRPGKYISKDYNYIETLKLK